MMIQPAACTSRIRLLCVGSDLRGGGAERIQLTLLAHLDRSRFDVRLFYLRNIGTLHGLIPRDIVPRYGVRGDQNLRARALHVLTALVRLARQADVIFAMQEGTPVYLAAIAGHLTGRPVVGWIRICWSRMLNELGGWHRWASRFFYPRLDLLICVSDGVARDLVTFCPTLRGKTVFVPNPQDLERIRGQAQAPLPQSAEHAFEKRTLLATGRFVQQKGFDVLLKAFADLTRRGLDLHLIILGEGPERSRLEHLANELGLSPRVFMPGFQINPYPFFARAEVFLLTSRYEGFANVIVEALCLGVPLVASDCPHGPREILQDGRCGILIPAENPTALADAVESILGSTETRARLRAAGLHRAQQYDVRTGKASFENLLANCLRPSTCEGVLMGADPPTSGAGPGKPHDH